MHLVGRITPIQETATFHYNPSGRRDNVKPEKIAVAETGEGRAVFFLTICEQLCILFVVYITPAGARRRAPLRQEQGRQQPGTHLSAPRRRCRRLGLVRTASRPAAAAGRQGAPAGRAAAMKR